MKEKDGEKHEACNAIGVLLSSWSWYEKFHNILGRTPKMTSAIVALIKVLIYHIFKW
jgi:hypothetical protein